MTAIALPAPVPFHLFGRVKHLNPTFAREMPVDKSINAAVAKPYNNLPDFLILFLEYLQDRVAIIGGNRDDDGEDRENESE